MSCERNQTSATNAAAASGGVPGFASKVGNFIGRKTGVGFVVQKLKQANEHACAERGARLEVERHRREEAAARKVAQIKNPERQQAIANLQKMIGSQMRRSEIDGLFNMA